MERHACTCLFDPESNQPTDQLCGPRGAWLPNEAAALSGLNGVSGRSILLGSIMAKYRNSSLSPCDSPLCCNPHAGARLLRFDRSHSSLKNLEAHAETESCIHLSLMHPLN
eukprot:55708-Chlamydomonas_euryale.AAC.4